ncbi:MAG: Ig-like domain-containing protein, partial [Anaerolinea sp.]|nr:Ig-like domain-containing protein [Anaerolinea sp.]
LDGPLTVILNKELNPQSVLSALVVEPPVSGDWQVTAADGRTTLTLHNSPVLPPATTYMVNFANALVDADNQLLAAPTPATFTTPAVVAAVSPQPNYWWWYHGTNPHTDISITFTREMDEASVNAAFTITPPIAGELTWLGNRLTFHPAAGHLDGYTAYTVAIQPDARDAAGDAVFPQPYTWSFATSDLYTAADFGIGDDVQVVDADGRRAIQYRSYETDPITVTFSLYDLTMTQAVQMLQHNGPTIADLPPVITWTAVTTPQPFSSDNMGGYLNPQETIIPTSAPPGPYILTLDADGRIPYHDELLLFLTQHTLVVKRADAQLTAWATDINGAAAGALEMSVWDDQGRAVANGRAAADGIFQTILPPGVTPAFVLARRGDDLTVTGLDGRWGPNSRYFRAPPTTLIHVSTDRPLYRPGHTVYFKAILRHNDDARLSPLAAGTAVIAQLRDSRGNLVQSLPLSANHFGTVQGEFQLGEGAMLGQYQVIITAPDGNEVAQRFKVEEYRKPDYTVQVTTGADHYLAGEGVLVTVDSAYFFGEPVVNAAVQVYLFSSGSYYDDEWVTFDEPQQGQTDSNGRFTLALTPRAGQYTLEAAVDDGSHQSVSGFHQITVHDRAESIALDSGSFVKEPGAPAPIQVTVTDIWGAAVANRAVRLQLRHYNPDNYDMDLVETFTGQTDSSGRFTLPITPADPGYYTLSASATDRLGHDIFAERYFFAYDSTNRASRWYGRSDALTIRSGQPSYAPGDTAQVFIQSTFGGPALLTFERAAVHRQQLVTLTPPLTVVDVTILESDTPNIFVNVMAWQPLAAVELGRYSQADSRLLFAEMQLPISLEHKTLAIAITPDKTQYQPGDTVSVTLRVTNSQGHPVSAEVALAVVDEALFSLSPDLTPAMLGAFYFPRPNQVNYYDALRPNRRLWYEGEPGGMGGGGGDGEGELPLTGKPRRDFQDTAAWFPALHTDYNGEVTISFTLPDNLTSWRFTARAITTDTQAGEATHNVTTWKPVIARPILPRALTAGDDFTLTALIHNNSSAVQTLTVNLSTSDPQLAIHNFPTQTITIAAGTSQVVGWPVTAVAAATITLTLQASNEDGPLDVVELPLTIRPFAIPHVTTQVGQFNGRFTTEILWPETALDSGGVQLDLNRSLAGSMVQGLEYLTGYPYGCVEQTMSRALPNAVVARAFQELGVSDPLLRQNLEPLVRASVQRLYSFQHADGGWGWWTDDASDDYQTAWVVFGLVTTDAAGYAVDPAVIERGAAWLHDRLLVMDTRTRAFALYSLALAGYGDSAITLATAAQTAVPLDTFSRAALALALHELGETAAARQMVEGLAADAVNVSGLVYWAGDAQDGHYQQKTMASTTRSTALALSAFVQIWPGHDLEAGMVRYLMSQRRSTGWGSTNETAFTILALTDHLLRIQEVGGDAATVYTISLNGQIVVSGTLAVNALSARVELPAASLRPGSNELTITHEGLLYYALHNRVYLAQEAIEAAGVVSVNRLYRDGLTGETVTAVAPNQLVQVQVTVILPAAAAYVIVADSLPGGLEALNDNLETTALLAGDGGRPYWERRGYNYKEIRGGQVSFFITEMAAGSHTFTYYARATHSGTFSALPVEVYAMYDLTVWGRSASQRLLVLP